MFLFHIFSPLQCNAMQSLSAILCEIFCVALPLMHRIVRLFNRSMFSGTCMSKAIGGICTPKTSIVHHLFTDWTDLWQVAAKKIINTNYYYCYIYYFAFDSSHGFVVDLVQKDLRSNFEITKTIIVKYILNCITKYFISAHAFIKKAIQNPRTKYFSFRM